MNSKYMHRRDEILSKFKDGKGISIIAREYGVSRQRIHQILVEMGYTKIIIFKKNSKPSYEQKRITYFWNHVIKGKEDECWKWVGAISHKTYGVISYHSKKIYVHRFIWEIMNGPIPEGMCVCHHCDTPLCVNPKHLFIGTHSDNTQDMLKKNRHPVMKSMF